MCAEQWVPGNKADLMSAIRREWQLLMDAAAKLDEQKMTTPDEGGWSPKDNLAHLAEWMNALMGHHIDKRPAHEALSLPQEVTKDWDFEVINPVLFERNKDRSIEDIMDDLKLTYNKMIAKLEAMSFDDLLKPRYPDDPKKRPLLLWVLGDTTEHFQEHRQVIERMLPSR